MSDCAVVRTTKLCYIVTYADSHLHTCTYIRRIIHSDTINKQTHAERRRKTSLTIFTSHFIARVRKGCSRFACERELEIEHKLQRFDPTVMTVTLCLSCSPDAGVHSIGVPEGPLGRVWLSLPHLVSSCLELYWQLLWLVELN